MMLNIVNSRPIFEKPNIEVSVYENAEVGKSLETFKATDPDQGGKSKVSFKIDRSSDKKRQFQISQDGTVTIQRTLDREDTPRHQVCPHIHLTKPNAPLLLMKIISKNRLKSWQLTMARPPRPPRPR